MEKILLLIALLSLSSCAPRVVLPAELVLERASSQSRSLSAARFEADVSYNEMITARITGIVQNGGNQAISEIEIHTGPTNFVARYLIASQTEQYLLIHATTVDSLKALVGQWWSLNANHAPDSASIPLSPDPALLQRQMGIIHVTRDRGFVQIDGHTTYHYDVELDHEKASDFLKEVARQSGQNDTSAIALQELQFKGEVWIDADSFLPRRIVWNITSTDQQKPLNIQLTVTIHDQDSAIAIEPPNDAKPFPIETSVMTDILRSVHL